jgi:hypothetical protein
MANLTVNVPPTVVMIAKPLPIKKGETLPKWDFWRRSDNFKVLEMLCASSFVGHSTAKIALSTGLPGKQIDVEFGDDLLRLGDRVAIGLERRRGQIDWQFCGYATTTQLTISNNSERRIWKISGPEWWLGDGNSGSGAGHVVRGQARRKAQADDTWRQNQSSVTPYDGWDIFTDEKAVFNPRGRANMTRDEAILSPPKSPGNVRGNIWETPDRRIDKIDVARFWDMRRACKVITEIYGDIGFSGIDPMDWEDTPMSILDVMRETDIDGVGCYEALRRILSNRYGFFIDPRPMTEDGTPVAVRGTSWGPFQLRFFPRTSGDEAQLWLNRRGTMMTRAKASVTRLEVAREAGKSPNRVIVGGSYARAIRLIYWGAYTPSALQDGMYGKIALQHGWKTEDGDLTTFSKPGDFKIDGTWGGVSAAKRAEWLSKYHADGSDFVKHARIFRRFTWNEAGDIAKGKTKYRTTIEDIITPELTDIADTPEYPTSWYRRRRKAMDTLYLKNESASKYEKLPPTLWIAIAPSPTDSNWDVLQWRKVQSQYYQLDADNCSFTITVDDLSAWRPMEKQDTADASLIPGDMRSFATLLNEGTLRLCLECTIPIDNGMDKIAEPGDTAALPYYREIAVAAEQNFVTTLIYDDKLTPPSGLNPVPLDMSAEALRNAELTRDAAQDEQIHASLTAAGDWDRQKIGALVKTIKGRDVDITGRSKRGAQIVAVRLDVESFNYEYLTETLALQIKEREQKTFDRYAQVYRNAKRHKRIENEPDSNG